MLRRRSRRGILGKAKMAGCCAQRLNGKGILVNFTTPLSQGKCHEDRIYFLSDQLVPAGSFGDTKDQDFNWLAPLP